MEFHDTYMLDRYEQILVYPKEEMERRWALARRVMEEQGADLMLCREPGIRMYHRPEGRGDRRGGEQ